MNEAARPIKFYSAYPLRFYTGKKAPKKQESPYLTAVLSGNKRVKAAIRLFPMAIPHIPVKRTLPPDTSLLPVDIELTDKSWFNHYE